ncbi:MAG: bacteriohemerythrin [Thermodesulfobacteriota bacterium]
MSQRMKWTKDCRLGIDQIDSQHRLLFAIANELIDFENPQEETLEFKYLLNHLRQYVDHHFSYEEQFMADNGYPELEDHRKKHMAIVEEINSILKGIKSLLELKGKLDLLMQKWIQEHILTEDQKISEWLRIRNRKAGGGETPASPQNGESPKTS